MKKWYKRKKDKRFFSLVGTINYNRHNLPVALLTSGELIKYKYNSAGERIIKIDVTGVSADYYLRDYTGRTLAIYDYYTNDLRSVNIHGNGLVGRIDINGASTTKYYYLKDHLGNMRQTIKDDGTIVSSTDYYPYGEEIDGRDWQNGVETRYKFTEKERDTETMYDYFGARYYDPQIARWHAMDPADEFFSPYLYVGNNPVNFIDPDGRQVDSPENDVREEGNIFEALGREIVSSVNDVFNTLTLGIFEAPEYDPEWDSYLNIGSLGEEVVVKPEIIPPIANLKESDVISTYKMRYHPVDKVWKFHHGIDIGIPINTPIIAPENGRITYYNSNISPSAGRYLIMKGTSGYYYRFLHLNSSSLISGANVNQGQQIALSGNTGKSTGPHLHFEIHTKNPKSDYKSYSVNPSPIIFGR